MKCKYNRNAGVKDNEKNKCELVTNEEQLLCYNKSNIFYKTLYTGTEEEKKDMVNKWAGIHNCGITHYGLHPSLLPVERLVWDVFHMKSVIFRTMMLKTRKLIDTQAIDIKKSWIKELLNQCKSWDQYNHSV